VATPNVFFDSSVLWLKFFSSKLMYVPGEFLNSSARLKKILRE
jgi:hypothetical protein